ncbi:MAG: stage V sporulation protein D [Oscillospiraceae bacterium]|nr:stage V sporulation protein D [Oscillospiraceae bacterium]
MNKRPTKRMSLRSHIAFAGFCVFLLLLIGNLFWIQIIHGEEYRLKAERNQLSDTVINAHRGTIYDSNMKVIAQSASAWLVYINPSKITTDEQKTLLIDCFTEMFGLDRETVEKKVDRKESGYEKIIGQIDNAQKEKLSEFISGHKDQKLSTIVGIDPDTKRYYPLGSFASTVVGFTGSEDTGRAGLELKYNTELTGQAGRIITAKNALAGAMPNDYETTFDARQGYSLVLTVNEVIQYYLEQQLAQAIEETDAKYAYGIVMDVKTGAILGMSTKPDYDLNSPYTISSNKVLEELEKIEDETEKSSVKQEAQFAQWRNRTVSDSYEPGSVFKVFVAAAALEEGVMTPQTQYTCTGQIQVANYFQHCFHNTAHGTQTVAQALPNSCNTFFITMGQRMGKETFFKYFEAFGFTEKTGIDLPSEAAPVAGRTYYDVDHLGIAELSSASFGQTFQATPIQMITAVASIGNGGKLMTPYIVAKVLDENGNIVSETKPIVRRQVISEKTASLVAGYMEEVVISGTAKNAYVAGYHISGKTGTSEKLTVKGQDIASFAGFAPSNDPRIAVLIAVDEPQGVTTGGAVAAPIAGRIFENILAYLNVDPQYSDEEMASTTVTAPNLIGEDSSTVKSKASGFTVKVVGGGETVISQMPSANQPMPKGGIIVVYTEENAARQTATVPKLIGLTMSEANRAAVNAGFNIKISGTTQSGGEVHSYNQSIQEGTPAEQGTIITVYFKSDVNVSD